MISTTSRLKEGLIENAAREMGWSKRNYRFHYTITDEIRGGKRERSKACNPDDANKYLWGRGDSVIYYHPPGIKEAINANGGLVYFAAGEVDVLTFIEADRRNVIGWFGEGNVPKTLAEDMKSLGVKEIHYWPDRDNTGRVSGGKVLAAMGDTGIICKVFELPSSLGDGADTNDLFVHYRGDIEAFKAGLENCKALILPKDKLSTKWISSANYEQVSDDELIQLICNRLGLTEFAKDGFSKQAVSVPFRIDNHPSGAFNRNTGVLLDRATGIGYAKFKVAKALGIEWKRPQPAKASLSPVGEKFENKPGLLFEGTTPDSYRSALLNYYPPSAAAVFELLHELARQGFIDPQDFTRDEVFEQQNLVGFDLSHRTIRDMLDNDLASFYAKCDIKRDSDSMQQKAQQLGRPAQTYHFASLEEVQKAILAWARPRILERAFPGDDYEQFVTVFEASMLQDAACDSSEAAEIAALLNAKTKDFRLNNEAQYKRLLNRSERQYFALQASLSNFHSTELPPAPIRKAKDYRALYLRGQVEAGQDSRSGRELAQALGIKRQSVNRLLSHVGIESISQYEKVIINKSNIANLERIGHEVMGYPRTVQIENEFITYNPEDAPSVISAAIEQGKEVIVTYQVKNKQIIATDDIFLEKPADKPEKRKVEATEKPAKEQVVSAENRKEQRHYGPTFDPVWIRHHLILALEIAKMGYVRRGAALVDTRTGERWLIETLSPVDIIGLLRGETLQREVA